MEFDSNLQVPSAMNLDSRQFLKHAHYKKRSLCVLSFKFLNWDTILFILCTLKCNTDTPLKGWNCIGCSFFFNYYFFIMLSYGLWLIGKQLSLELNPTKLSFTCVCIYALLDLNYFSYLFGCYRVFTTVGHFLHLQSQSCDGDNLSVGFGCNDHDMDL